MKKIFSLLIIIFLMTGCGGEKNSNDAKSPKYSRIITVGFDEFAPMGFTENGEVVGFDIDLAKEAAKRMGVTFEFKPIDWGNKESELDSGNVDMIWNGLSMLEDRKEHMTFSKPYMDNRQIILVAKDNSQEIHSVGDLTGKIVAAQAGSSAETYIDEDEYLRNSFAKFKTYRNINEGFEALNKGEIDALI
ncbi:MAG: transporter substrate-binding domain-containing protein, partial [Selenomonadaceae bacterium]|nr:transporter substrate-binding domain-containing protein [Selenomonadaceae bacterium]